MSSPGAKPEKEGRKMKLNWPLVLLYIYLYLSALYGLFICFTEAKRLTVIFALFLFFAVPLGVTAGAHRLWAHRSYSASWPLRLVLIILHTIVGQGTVYDWVRDHRMHHLYYGTELDPYCVRRGFLFSHFGCHWVKQLDQIEKLQDKVNMSDIEDDPLVMFQKRYKWILIAVLCFFLPVNAPVELWNESILVSVFVIGFLRYALVMNVCWLVNSASSIWGLQVGDRYPKGDDIMGFLVKKTFWPTYHYLVPNDWRISDFGGYGTGISNYFIKLNLLIGTAWGSKTTNGNIIREAIKQAAQNGRSLQGCINELMN